MEVTDEDVVDLVVVEAAPVVVEIEDLNVVVGCAMVVTVANPVGS